MTKQEVLELVSNQAEFVDLGVSKLWSNEVSVYGTWCILKDPNNILERQPNDLLDDNNELAIEYDAAYRDNKGRFPSVKEYEELFEKCKKVHIEDDNGILLQGNGCYLYLQEGIYWTRDAQPTEDGNEWIPIHIEIKNKDYKKKTSYRFRKAAKAFSVKDK